MTDKPEATIVDMLYWATDIMQSRDPDFIIGELGNEYLKRWRVIPRNPFSNVYLHKILRSDDDRALHDHPWKNRSLLIKGRYLEVTPEGQFIRQPGDVVERLATDLHRLELIDNEPVISLFTTGPVEREWGFQCPQGWRHWKDFTATAVDGNSVIGRGCED